RPGRPISRKRRAFIRLVTQSLPSTNRFIAVFRLWARIIKAHQAALAPNRPDGSFPPARSLFITEWTSSLLPQRSRSHQITWLPASLRLVTTPNSLYVPLLANSCV